MNAVHRLYSSCLLTLHFRHDLLVTARGAARANETPFEFLNRRRQGPMLAALSRSTNP
jgi:hypothetical protein